MKDYRSSSFQKRIEASLANVSSSPEDEFRLVGAYYDTNMFDCQLCGHRNCVYAYEVENIETHRVLKVGSECIHHWKDKGVDIDLAEGLMQRVMKATQRARNKLIKEIGKEEYKKLSKEEKREKVTQQYMIEQVKDMLRDVAQNKSVLTEDEVKHILDLGLEEEYEEAKALSEKLKKRKELDRLFMEFTNYLDKLKKTWSKPDMEKIEEFRKVYEQYENSSILDVYLKNYQRQLEGREKYKWLYDYNGSNSAVQNIKKSLERNGSISPRQESYVKSLIDKEEKSNSDVLNRCFNFIFSHHFEDDFIKSLKRQYDDKGFLSEKQEKALMKIYNKKKHWTNA